MTGSVLWLAVNVVSIKVAACLASLPVCALRRVGWCVVMPAYRHQAIQHALQVGRAAEAERFPSWSSAPHSPQVTAVCPASLVLVLPSRKGSHAWMGHRASHSMRWCTAFRRSPQYLSGVRVPSNSTSASVAACTDPLSLSHSSLSLSPTHSDTTCSPTATTTRKTDIS